MRERRGGYKVLVEKPEGKRLLGRPRPRRKDNIKMDLQEVWTWTGSSWLRDRWRALMNAVRNLRVP